MGRLSVKGEDALAEKKISEQSEKISREFMHIYNLFLIYGQPRLDEFKRELRELGHDMNYIMSCERRGAAMSNWSRDKYVAERCESKGMAYARMSKVI